MKLLGNSKDYDTIVLALRQCPDSYHLKIYVDLWSKEDRSVAWDQLSKTERDRLRPIFEELSQNKT